MQLYTDKIHLKDAVANSNGGGRWGRPPVYWLMFFKKPLFFRVKGIYFVVRICDK